MSLEDFSSDWSSDSLFSDSNSWFGGGGYDDTSAWSLPSFSWDAPSMDLPVPVSPEMMPQTYGIDAPMQAMAGAQGGGYAPQMGAPGAQAPQGFGNQMLQPQNLLGLLGGFAGLAGTLAGGGKQQTITPNLSPQQKQTGALAEQSLGQMNQFAQGTSPLQQMQMSLLQALASGQGLPPGYAQLVEQAFQPQMGNIATQAIESARRRGFAGGAELLQQGPAGAIAGPMLADLQGQMAQAKLGLMQSLPQQYNQPIATQAASAGNQAQGYGNLFRSYPTGQTQSVPLGPQIGQAIGQGLTGLGTGMAQQQQQNSLMNALMGAQQRGGLSYDPQNMYG